MRMKPKSVITLTLTLPLLLASPPVGAEELAATAEGSTIDLTARTLGRSAELIQPE